MHVSSYGLELSLYACAPKHEKQNVDNIIVGVVYVILIRTHLFQVSSYTAKYSRGRFNPLLPNVLTHPRTRSCINT